VLALRPLPIGWRALTRGLTRPALAGAAAVAAGVAGLSFGSGDLARLGIGGAIALVLVAPILLPFRHAVSGASSLVGYRPVDGLGARSEEIE